MFNHAKRAAMRVFQSHQLSVHVPRFENLISFGFCPVASLRIFRSGPFADQLLFFLMAGAFKFVANSNPNYFLPPWHEFTWLTDACIPKKNYFRCFRLMSWFGGGRLFGKTNTHLQVFGKQLLVVCVQRPRGSMGRDVRMRNWSYFETKRLVGLGTKISSFCVAVCLTGLVLALNDKFPYQPHVSPSVKYIFSRDVYCNIWPWYGIIIPACSSCRFSRRPPHRHHHHHPHFFASKKNICMQKTMFQNSTYIVQQVKQTAFGSKCSQLYPRVSTVLTMLVLIPNPLVWNPHCVLNNFFPPVHHRMSTRVDHSCCENLGKNIGFDVMVQMFEIRAVDETRTWF